MKIGNILGVDIKLNWTLIILVIILMSKFGDYAQVVIPDASRFATLAISLLASLGLLLSILLHEFGHILVGRHYGINFKEVMLHIFGGAAVMDSNIPSAKAEFFMALAGPVVSFLLSLGCFILAIPFAIFDFKPALFVFSILGNINAALFIFNLFIVAFPLDGSRVLRAAIWWWKKDYVKATVIASKIGKVIGAAMVCCGVLMAMGVYIPMFGVGISNGIWISIMGLFINMAATMELKRVRPV